MICPNSVVLAAASVYRLVVARIIREIRGEEGTANISPEAAVAEAVGVGGSRYVLIPLLAAARRSSLS